MNLIWINSDCKESRRPRRESHLFIYVRDNAECLLFDWNILTSSNLWQRLFYLQCNSLTCRRQKYSSSWSHIWFNLNHQEQNCISFHVNKSKWCRDVWAWTKAGVVKRRNPPSISGGSRACCLLLLFLELRPPSAAGVCQRRSVKPELAHTRRSLRMFLPNSWACSSGWALTAGPAVCSPPSTLCTWAIMRLVQASVRKDHHQRNALP